MFQTPDYQHNMSLKLSEVLDDIGVNEDMVERSRRAHLLQETIMSLSDKCINNYGSFTYYIFGSQSEGTTTIDLNSDCDLLNTYTTVNVIQKDSELKRGYTNLRMLKDNTTAPGYCLLHKPNNQPPLQDIKIAYVKDKMGRVLLKNTEQPRSIPGAVQHGPSWSQPETSGILALDRVNTFPCYSWPSEAQEWIDRRGVGKWPTSEMKKFAINSGCLVVSVSSKLSHNPELEWRISTSLAERCLMFNLNITQIRCYVLMKMLRKTVLTHRDDSQISSYMCKTVLFHCIENTLSSAWKKSNLIICLLCCLRVLYNYVQQENCPHFIILGNNLMAGQFSPDDKAWLLERISYLIKSYGQALLQVEIDHLGKKLQNKLDMIGIQEEDLKKRTVVFKMQTYDDALHGVQLQSQTEDFKEKCTNYDRNLGHLLINTACRISQCYGDILSDSIKSRSNRTALERLRDVLTKCKSFYRAGSRIDQISISLLSPFLITTIGSILASSCMETNNTLSKRALDWLKTGLNSDVMSSRLKLASVYYGVGNMEMAESILKDKQGKFDFDDVHSLCGCYDPPLPPIMGSKFTELASTQKELAVQNACAFCVIFTSHEINCVPHELRYEMYRSMKDDMKYRDDKFDFWMDWAVVDSFPYLYFLQYKTYGHLKKFYNQQEALTYLHRSIQEHPNLGHRETALNLLGQCMEQENQPDQALYCYIESLKIRKRNNVAKIHICKLLAKLIKAKRS